MGWLVGLPCVPHNSAVLKVQNLRAGPGAQCLPFLSYMSPRNRTGWGWGTRTCSAVPCSYSPHPTLPWLLDSQGFWAWGVRRGYRPELSEFLHQVPNLPPEILSSLPSPITTCSHPIHTTSEGCPLSSLHVRKAEAPSLCTSGFRTTVCSCQGKRVGSSS